MVNWQSLYISKERTSSALLSISNIIFEIISQHSTVLENIPVSLISKDKWHKSVFGMFGKIVFPGSEWIILYTMFKRPLTIVKL